MRLHAIVYTNAAGRRVSRLDTFDGASAANVFGYNARSEVTSALMGTNAFEYAYDPIGNRVESSQNSTTNIYAANALNQYVTISNLCASVPLCEPTYDANGNITEYVTTNGTVAAHYEYSAFGEPIVASGELASSFTYRFSTKPHCAVTGFSEYQMREYGPDVGRWLSRDTIDAPIVINDAVMVNNNLIDNLDFLGNMELVGIGACLVKCGVKGAFEDLVGDFFAKGVFCGDLKRECEQNLIDFLTGRKSSPFPPPSVLPPPMFGKQRVKRIANCLFSCLHLDKVGLGISSNIEMAKSGSDDFSCNKKTKRVDYSLDVSIEMFVEPGHILVFSGMKKVAGTCDNVTFGTCCPCVGK